jgi:hypothetical protein
MPVLAKKQITFICFSAVLIKGAFEIKNNSKIIFQVFLNRSLSKKKLQKITK